jgi:hypothetical protein
MGRVMAHRERPPDPLRHPRGGPHLPDEPVRLRTLGEHLRQLGALLGRQFRRRVTRGGCRRASLPPSRPALSHWLTASRVTPSASAIGLTFHPRSYSAHARSRRPSFQSWGAASFVVLLHRGIPQSRPLV